MNRGERVQLVFVTVDGTEVNLDCLGSNGVPFSITARLPYTATWAALATESVLRRWADDGTAVVMAKVESRAWSSVRLSDDERRLQLTLAA